MLTRRRNAPAGCGPAAQSSGSPGRLIDRLLGSAAIIFMVAVLGWCYWDTPSASQHAIKPAETQAVVSVAPPVARPAADVVAAIESSDSAWPDFLQRGEVDGGIQQAIDYQMINKMRNSRACQVGAQLIAMDAAAYDSTHLSGDSDTLAVIHPIDPSNGVTRFSIQPRSVPEPIIDEHVFEAPMYVSGQRSAYIPSPPRQTRQRTSHSSQHASGRPRRARQPINPPLYLPPPLFSYQQQASHPTWTMYSGSSYGLNPSMSFGSLNQYGNMGYGNYTTHYLNGGDVTHSVTTTQYGNQVYVNDYSYGW